MFGSSKLKVTYREVESLTPYEKNARVHTDAQIDQIINSIVEFGFTSPILIDEHGTVIAGHGRLMAAERLKMDRVPTITLAGLSERQKRAYTIADNKLALNARWDADLLKMEANELLAMGLDVDLLGFSEIEQLAFFGNVVDPSEEWDGMPEFDQQNAKAFRTIVMHFHDEDGVNQFVKAIDADITEKTKYIWYPEIDIVPRGEMVVEEKE